MEDLEKFNHYQFTCSSCFADQYISYAKDLLDPDKHVCYACNTVFWWSPVQKKLYLEETQTELPETYMRVL